MHARIQRIAGEGPCSSPDAAVSPADALQDRPESKEKEKEKEKEREDARQARAAELKRLKREQLESQLKTDARSRLMGGKFGMLDDELTANLKRTFSLPSLPQSSTDSTAVT